MEPDNSQRIAKNTLYLFIRMVLVMIVSLYTSRVVLKVLGVDDFGIYNVVGSVVVFLSFFRNALTNATYRYLAYELGVGDLKRLKETYSMAINCHILLAFFFFFILEAGGLWLLNNKLNIDESRIEAAKILYNFSVVTFCIGVVQTPFNSSIIAHERMNFYAVISILEVVLKLGVALVLPYSPIDNLVFYGFLLLCVAIILLLFYITYCRVSLNDCSYIRIWDNKMMKKFASYSGWSLLVNTADVTTTQSVAIFFNVFLGVVANAALGITNQVCGCLSAFLGSFTQALNPQIIKSYAAKKYVYFTKLLFSSSKLSFYLLFIISIPVFLNTEYILNIWLGEYPPIAISYIRIMMLFYLIDSCQTPLWQAVHATGNLRVHQVLMSVIKFSTIPLIYFILKSGKNGTIALACWVSTNLLCAVVRTWYMKRLINMDIRDYLWQVIVKMLIVSLLTIPIPFYVVYKLGVSTSGFLASTGLSLFISIIVIYFVGINEAEKNILKNMSLYKKMRHLIQK